MDYKIQHTYEVTQTHEFSVDWNGFNFLIIYGHHINGWFIAIPNWNKCTEAGNPSDVAYNATKIAQTHIHDIAPMYLAQAIADLTEVIMMFRHFQMMLYMERLAVSVIYSILTNWN